MQYADTYNTRSDPNDEHSAGWRITRNGAIYARRETLGAARALIARIEAYAGSSEWVIEAL